MGLVAAEGIIDEFCDGQGDKNCLGGVVGAHKDKDNVGGADGDEDELGGGRGAVDEFLRLPLGRGLPLRGRRRPQRRGWA